MSNLQLIYDDISSLRGANVQIFGQPRTLDSEVEEMYIDILDVVDSLRKYEVTELVDENYDDEDNEIVTNFETVEEYLDFLEDIGLTELKSDNSYNWSSPISNEFDFTTYRDFAGDYYVKFKVHRYGDVRANYTNDALLKFNYESEFLEILLESNKSIYIKGYDVEIDIFSDGYEVYKDGEYVKTIYDLDDMDKIDEAV